MGMGGARRQRSLSPPTLHLSLHVLRRAVQGMPGCIARWLCSPSAAITLVETQAVLQK